jgi:valyl-tRNA synthetase
MKSPEESGKEGKWSQEEDVLDTWFSSWLWPFSIMGWPEDTDDQKFFYPTDDLVTGPDIIFFWVARMIMAGYEFKGELPFKNVYFTSILRDEKGRKLSKSLGNSPDPLDVIQQYGADALRFSIIYIAPLGQDILYSNDKCEIGRNFANKLWNASRFRTMHGPSPETVPVLTKQDFDAANADDKWILSRLLQVSASVNKSLDSFRFHEAVHSLYEFVWSEFCDWYIESSKQSLFNEDTKDATLKVMDYALYTILRLLHPFMPFVTEEIALQLGYITEGSSIVLSSYPSEEELAGFTTVDESLMSGMDAKFALIRAGRNMRASYNIPPSKKIEYFFKPNDAEIENFLQSETASIEKLMRAESIKVDGAFSGDAKMPSIVTDAGILFMSLEGLIDIEAEKAKLNKQKKELEGWIKGSKAKLSNKNFIEKAPEKVVEEAKLKLEEMEAKLARVIDMLNAL